MINTFLATSTAHTVLQPQSQSREGMQRLDMGDILGTPQPGRSGQLLRQESDRQGSRFGHPRLLQVTHWVG